MDEKTCNICQTTLPISNFTKGKSTCKTCRNSKANQSYDPLKQKKKYDSTARKIKYRQQKDEEWLLERTPLRNEMLREWLDDGCSIESFNTMFVKLEDYDKYGDNPDYQFAYSKVFKTEFVPKEFIDKGYILDCMMCGKYGERKINQIFFII